jgi:hypothetical protein
MSKSCARTGCTFVFVLAVFVMSRTPLFALEGPTPIVHRPEAFVVSPSLRELATMPAPLGYGIRGKTPEPRISGNSVSPVLGSVEQTSPVVSSNFSIGLNFLGLGNGFLNFTPSSAPPDTTLAVGDTQIVQWTDPVFAVFDKSSGQVQAGPILGNTLWSSLGGACADATAGIELIVQWDKAHQRWLLAENTVGGPPYYSCVAVSTSSDALGTYYLYQFPQGTPLLDSPKWSVWSNGYYQSQGEYSNSEFVGPKLCAYNSAKLVVGDGSAEQICFVLSLLRMVFPCQPTSIPVSRRPPTKTNSS